MNKKGFTLIELLAVVTIIILISIIAIPNITRTIREKKSEISSTNMKLLTSAAEVYIENNQEKYTYGYEADGSTYCIPIQTLIDKNYLETPFKDTSGQEIDYSKQLKATYEVEYNSFNYELVDNSECTELIQYISRPRLADNMIPVIYDETTNKWIKANENTHWYNYTQQKWANTVLVKEQKETVNSKSRYDYKNAPAGTEILEDDILAMFVWIPRFRYQLFESNANQQINIVFESADTIKSTGTTQGEWLTHPAFTYNNQELSGIWVAKYESSNSNNSIIIKANQTAWTDINYVEANNKIIEMSNNINIYGIKNANTHMIRNSEWGALAYLTNSIYGNLENNSTTGNITGVYNIEGNKEFAIIDNQDEKSLGYALNETKTWTADNSYPTAENLYLTRGNNSIFNYQNSKVIDANTTFRIVLTNIETQDQTYKRKYVVTLDPNGGILSETTKEVSYNEPYGNIPTPTREGYTLLGWNGKNLFNKEATPVSSTSYIRGDGVVVSNTEYSIYQVDVKPNTTYTITNSGKSTAPGYAIYDSGDTRLDGANYANNEKITFTTPANASYIKLSVVTNNTSYRYDKETFQLEENSTTTEYESFYITKDSIVRQDKNHTLKAIWQAN